ncbi:MAG: phosphodiester glycosidase family protein, partial [Burkholderiales bacterium]|nr:phosphodiester glycosidase family protein [Burkholderiales bacterium]
WALASDATFERARLAPVERCLAGLGLTPAIRRYAASAPARLPYWIASGGRFATAPQARRLAARAACSLHVVNRMADPDWKAGPWDVHLLVVDPRRYRGRIVVRSAPGATRVSRMARAAHAVAGVNAGFFVTDARAGYVGSPAGISVIQGEWRREPVAARPYLVVEDGTPASMAIRRQLPALPQIRWGDGTRTVLDGLNRRPGLIPNCGSLTHPQAARPEHDHTCRVADDLVAIRADEALDAPAPDAVVARVGCDGRLTRSAGAPRPCAYRLVATGTRRQALIAKLRRNGTARLDLRFGPSRDPGLYAVNGGPLLVADGRPVHDGAAEGWRIDRHSSDAAVTGFHDWYRRRNPRTAVGITGRGLIYLLTVDGREFDAPSAQAGPGSVGLTIDEVRRVMMRLGAQDAMGLDGGGSTTAVVRGRLVNLPSDAGGERAVGDAILLLDR